MFIKSLRQQWQQHRAEHFIRTSRYEDKLRDLPTGLFLYWQKAAPAEFPGIPQDAFFFAQASEGLIRFFDCVAQSPLACALPSKAADSVWHAWNHYSSISLDQYCYKHFGRTIPHLDETEMGGGIDHALAACLVAARKQDRISDLSKAVPTLFRLDAQLHMPNGYAYRHHSGKLGFRNISAYGTPEGSMIFPESFQPNALFALGLLNEHNYNILRQRAFARGKHTSSDTGLFLGPTSGGTSTDAIHCGGAHSGHTTDCSSSHGGTSCGSSCSSSGGSSCGSSCGSSS